MQDLTWQGADATNKDSSEDHASGESEEGRQDR